MYILTFMLALLSIEIARKLSTDKGLACIYKPWSIYIVALTLIFAAFILAFLAGNRNSAIGTDTLAYFTHFDNIDAYRGEYSREPLYVLYIVIVKSITDNSSLFIFITHFIMYFLVIVGLFRLRGYINITLGLLLYLFLFYNQSYNAIRQYFSISILFVMFKDIIDRRYLKFFVAIIVSSLFHNTALAALLIPISRVILDLRVKRKWLIVAIYYSLLIGLIVAFKPILNLLINILGILPEYFSIYLNLDPEGGVRLIPVMKFLLLIICVIALKTDNKSSKAHSRLSDHKFIFELLFMIAIFEVILLYTSLQIRHAARISYLFAVLTAAILYPRAINLMKNAISKMFSTVFLCFFAGSYWYYMYVFRNFSDTVPYQSAAIDNQIYIIFAILGCVLLINFNVFLYYKVLEIKNDF